jgi:NADH:ubiquinone oxidoreductase subunit 4 (subunit M)
LQRDAKRLVAYRRVAHINYSIVVICLARREGDRGRRIILLRHRVIRRILLLLRGVRFHFLGTRILYLLRERLLLKRIITLLLLRVVVRNFALPPSLGFLGEVSSLIVGLRIL